MYLKEISRKIACRALKAGDVLECMVDDFDYLGIKKGKRYKIHHFTDMFNGCIHFTGYEENPFYPGYFKKVD